MGRQARSYRKVALVAFIGVFLAFSAAWAGILIPGGLPESTGIDWFVTGETNVLAWGGNGELGLHVTGISPAVGDDDTEDAWVYAYDKSGGPEYPLYEDNMLVIRTHWNSVALENVTVSNDTAAPFDLSSLLLWPDGGTFTGFNTPAESSQTGNWTFNVTHRGFHVLYDALNGEPVPAVLAKVEKDSNFVEVVYNPFGEPVEATVPLIYGATSATIETAAGLEQAAYSLPRRYTTGGLDVDLGTVYFNGDLIPSSPGYNFELAVTNWGSNPITIPLPTLDLGDPGRMFFLFSPEACQYNDWIGETPTSRDLPPAFSFGKAGLCDAYLDSAPLESGVEIPGTFTGAGGYGTTWGTSFMAKAYRWMAAFMAQEVSMQPDGWDSLDLVHFRIPSTDLDGMDARYPTLVGTATPYPVYNLDEGDLVVTLGEGQVEGFTGDVRYLDLDVPYSIGTLESTEDSIPVLPLRVRMDLSAASYDDLPDAVAEALGGIATDVADDMPFDQAFLERFHIYVVLPDGEIVDLVEAAENAGLDPTNVIRMMGTAVTIPSGMIPTAETGDTTEMFCRGQAFGAVVDGGPAGVTFSEGSFLIHDGDGTDSTFTARIVLAPVSAREVPEENGGGGCSAAGAWPLALFLLAPLGLLFRRR
jgi:Synergist-CTERM protein sorting domain-containing protein